MAVRDPKKEAATFIRSVTLTEGNNRHNKKDPDDRGIFNRSEELRQSSRSRGILYQCRRTFTTQILSFPLAGLFQLVQHQKRNNIQVFDF